MSKQEWLEIGLAYLAIAFMYAGVIGRSPQFAAVGIPILVCAVISQQVRKLKKGQTK